jgi:hypothetical protein
MEVSGQLQTLARYSLRKIPRSPLDRWLGDPQSRSEHYGEEKILSCWEYSLNLPAQSTSLYWLDYPCSNIYILQNICYFEDFCLSVNNGIYTTENVPTIATLSKVILWRWDCNLALENAIGWKTAAVLVAVILRDLIQYRNVRDWAFII